MFSVRPDGALVASCVLLLASSAAADGKRCVALNNDGADQRVEHRLIASRAAYRSCADKSDCPAIVREECVRALAELRLAIPTVLVSVTDERHQYLPDATLRVDGNIVAVDGSPLELDPGSHEFIASKGGVTTKLQVLAAESDLNRSIEIVLETPEPVQRHEPTPAEPAPVAQSPQPARAPAYVLSGVAAVGAASFAYFALSGHGEMSALERCKPDCSVDAVHRVGTSYHLADISLGVSVVALASAGYFLLVKPSAPSATSGTLGLDLVRAEGGAFLNLRLRE